MRIACCECKIFFTCIKNGIIVDNRDANKNTICYWRSDLFECLTCHKRIMITADKSIMQDNSNIKYEVYEK